MEDYVEAAADLSAGDRTRYIMGMAEIGESVKILIDIDKVFGQKAIGEVERAAAS